jgi:hypothetical protein
MLTTTTIIIINLKVQQDENFDFKRGYVLDKFQRKLFGIFKRNLKGHV